MIHSIFIKILTLLQTYVSESLLQVNLPPYQKKGNSFQMMKALKTTVKILQHVCKFIFKIPNKNNYTHHGPRFPSLASLWSLLESPQKLSHVMEVIQVATLHQQVEMLMQQHDEQCRQHDTELEALRTQQKTNLLEL